MFESPEFLVLALVLFGSLLLLLYRERSEKRRLASEENLPIEHRLPRHYRSFAEVEKKLWTATEEYEQKGAWETARLSLRPPELKVVRDYLDGLREDFQRGNRIFLAVIRHSPDSSLLAQLEWQRSKIQVSFQLWYMVVSLRLSTDTISVKELRRPTDIVAALAYQVRTMLSIFEESGNAEFVQRILKNV